MVDGGCDCFQSVGLVELQAVVVAVPTLRLYICKQETVSAFTLPVAGPDPAKLSGLPPTPLPDGAVWDRREGDTKAGSRFT